MNGSIVADAKEIAHRPAASSTADAAGAARDAAESRGEPRARRPSARRPRRLPSAARPVLGDGTQPHRHARAAAGGAPSAKRPNPGRTFGRADRGKQARADARRIAAARLSELAAEPRAVRHATALERLVVNCLTRYHHGIHDESRRALASAEPLLTGTVWDAVVAATVEHVCTTPVRRRAGVDPGPERLVKRPWMYRCGPIERDTALTNASAAMYGRRGGSSSGSPCRGRRSHSGATDGLKYQKRSRVHNVPAPPRTRRPIRPASLADTQLAGHRQRPDALDSCGRDPVPGYRQSRVPWRRLSAPVTHCHVMLGGQQVVV